MDYETRKRERNAAEWVRVVLRRGCCSALIRPRNLALGGGFGRRLVGGGGCAGTGAEGQHRRHYGSRCTLWAVQLQRVSAVFGSCFSDQAAVAGALRGDPTTLCPLLAEAAMLLIKDC